MAKNATIIFLALALLPAELRTGLVRTAGCLLSSNSINYLFFTAGNISSCAAGGRR